jgi:hypothetical protein
VSAPPAPRRRPPGGGAVPLRRRGEEACRPPAAAGWARGKCPDTLDPSIPPSLAARPSHSNVADTSVSADVPASLAGKVTGVGSSSSPGQQQQAGGGANATQVDGAAANATTAAAGGSGGGEDPGGSANSTSSDAASAPDASSSGAAPPPPASAAAPAPAPAPAVISSAPICACALQGIASSDCLRALDARCSEAGAAQDVKDACSQVSAATTSPDAAAALATYLAGQCFVGQSMDVSPCVIFKVGLGARRGGHGARRRQRAAGGIAAQPACGPPPGCKGARGEAAGDGAGASTRAPSPIYAFCQPRPAPRSLRTPLRTTRPRRGSPRA